MKKVLIITYYWPPAGGPGVQRVLKFAKYLPQFGWDPIILTIENGDYHAYDYTLATEVPKSIKVYKTKVISVLDLYKRIKGGGRQISSFELTQKNNGFLTKAAIWIRANFFIPDARKSWNKSAVKKGVEIIDREKPDVIFTSSPPHSLQLIGLKLSKKTGIKWVADFRDPWTDAFWDKELPRLNLLNKYNAFLEQKVIKSANEIITVSNGVKELLNDNIKSHLLLNGYDESDFNGISKSTSGKFRITYVGSISNSQNPDNFFRALEELPDTCKNLLEVNFYGRFDSEVIKSSEKYGGLTKFHEYIPHNEAVQKIINSELLLLLIPRNSSGIITGKLYEYLATHNYIMALAPDKSEIDNILIKCNAGSMHGFNDNITEIIARQIELWKQHIKPKINKNEVEKFSREQITKQLADIFNNCL